MKNGDDSFLAYQHHISYSTIRRLRKELVFHLFLKYCGFEVKICGKELFSLGENYSFPYLGLVCVLHSRDKVV